MNTLTHLTDDQIDDALIGDLAVDRATHLTACAACQLRLEMAGEPLAHFNAVSLAWSERRSATMPTRAVSSSSVWSPYATWAATAAAVLAVAISIPVMHHSRSGKTLSAGHEAAGITLMAATGPVDNPVAAREEQIARDNQMLQNIDREMQSSADSPDREYGLRAVSSTSSTSAHAAQLPVRN